MLQFCLSREKGRGDIPTQSFRIPKTCWEWRRKEPLPGESPGIFWPPDALAEPSQVPEGSWTQSMDFGKSPAPFLPLFRRATVLQGGRVAGISLEAPTTLEGTSWILGMAEGVPVLSVKVFVANWEFPGFLPAHGTVLDKAGRGAG